MKTYSLIALAVVSVVLAVVLFTTKHADNAQMASDAAAIVDYSNRLDTAELHVSERNGALLLLSNTLAETTQTLSNQLTAAQATVAQDAEQLAKLNQQAAAAAAENQALSGRVMELTNQVAGLSGQLAQSQSSLAQTKQDLTQLHKDYALLDNRFRRDVAERLVVERKFATYAEVQAQAEKLKTATGSLPTPESIYKGLDVEVTSNGVAHVIAPE
jgi:chromosome segregation ATPase